MHHLHLHLQKVSRRHLCCKYDTSGDIVLHISQTGHAEDLGAIFVGLTRLKEDPRGSALYVVCSDSYLSEFGRKSAGNRYEESTLYKEELAKEAKLQKDAAEIVAKLFENP